MHDKTIIDPARQGRLKAIIKRLHAGEAASQVRRDFARLIEGVSAEEIAAMEQALVDEGLPVEEIQRLCEVHVEVFKTALEKGRRAESMPGHPVHGFIAENRAAAPRLKRLLREARSLAWGAGDAEAAGAALDDLTTMIIHYQRKENQLFPFLERVGFTGPSKVMWGKHDEIRAQFKAVRAALDAIAPQGKGKASPREAARRFRIETRKLAAMMRRMFFMEERILFPNALSRLSERDWALIRKGEEAIGWAWISPGAEYDAALVLARTSGAPTLAELIARASAPEASTPEAPATETVPTAEEPAGIALNTGSLSAELLDLVLRKLPVDISVVDEQDKVLYYSDNPARVFPRSPAVIGRDVRNCHPPKSLAVVERILDAFKAGTRDSARFWIEMGGKFVVIDYLALRDASGRYRGTLEMTQDAAELRALEGQRRLLDWE
jgi:DUF438 domain-containing protein